MAIRKIPTRDPKIFRFRGTWFFHFRGTWFFHLGSEKHTDICFPRCFSHNVRCHREGWVKIPKTWSSSAPIVLLVPLPRSVYLHRPTPPLPPYRPSSFGLPPPSKSRGAHLTIECPLPLSFMATLLAGDIQIRLPSRRLPYLPPSPCRGDSLSIHALFLLFPTQSSCCVKLLPCVTGLQINLFHS